MYNVRVELMQRSRYVTLKSHKVKDELEARARDAILLVMRSLSKLECFLQSYKTMIINFINIHIMII